LESSFDDLDALFGDAAEDCRQEQEEAVRTERGLGFEEVDEGDAHGRKVYFPEISLGDALEVTCDGKLLASYVSHETQAFEADMLARGCVKVRITISRVLLLLLLLL
jgi:hypothetical protein